MLLHPFECFVLYNFYFVKSKSENWRMTIGSGVNCAIKRHRSHTMTLLSMAQRYSFIKINKDTPNKEAVGYLNSIFD